MSHCVLRNAELECHHSIRSPQFIPVTIIEAINKAAKKLSEQGISTARLDAEVLLRHILSRDRAWLLAHIQEDLDETNRRIYEQAVDRRAKREPLQHITKQQEFWGLEFLVTPDVLIPRPETELIIESVLGAAEHREKPLIIIDLCTGSGCIAVSLAKELQAARIVAIDKSPRALSVARENALRHDVAERIRFLEGDLFEPLEALDIHGQADIIVSNPPYVPSGDQRTLQPEVRAYEPAMALFAGPDGTEIHRKIIDSAPRFLKTRGVLIMEMGLGQADVLVKMVRHAGDYGPAEILKDLAGINRVIVTRKK
ncbi:MAG: peptide chain release factor N(5)-glutamine methyltransferase [Betaproteobacteria bacterium]